VLYTFAACVTGRQGRVRAKGKVCVCVCVCVCECVCVFLRPFICIRALVSVHRCLKRSMVRAYVCVRERERDRERETDDCLSQVLLPPPPPAMAVAG